MEKFEEDILKAQQDRVDAIRKSFDNENDIKKGGEGSRGGKIIGHTKSGKPIYENKKAHTYKDFTEQDHRDASETHWGKHRELGGGNDQIPGMSGKKTKHEDLSYSHHVEAREASFTKESDKKDKPVEK